MKESQFFVKTPIMFLYKGHRSFLKVKDPKLKKLGEMKACFKLAIFVTILLRYMM